MRITTATPAAAAGLLAATMLLTGCSGSGDTAEAKPKPSPTVTVTTSPTGDGISKTCTNAVFDLLRTVDTDGTIDQRPPACADLTDTQWQQVVDEQGTKIFHPSGSGSGGATQQCIDAVAGRPADADGSLPFEPTPKPCAGLNDDDYMNAYMDGLNQSNQDGIDKLQKEIDEAGQ